MESAASAPDYPRFQTELYADRRDRYPFRLHLLTQPLGAVAVGGKHVCFVLDVSFSSVLVDFVRWPDLHRAIGSAVYLLCSNPNFVLGMV